MLLIAVADVEPKVVAPDEVSVVNEPVLGVALPTGVLFKATADVEPKVVAPDEVSVVNAPA